MDKDRNLKFCSSEVPSLSLLYFLLDEDWLREDYCNCRVFVLDSLWSTNSSFFTKIVAVFLQLQMKDSFIFILTNLGTKLNKAVKSTFFNTVYYYDKSEQRIYLLVYQMRNPRYVYIETNRFGRARMFFFAGLVFLAGFLFLEVSCSYCLVNCKSPWEKVIYRHCPQKGTERQWRQMLASLNLKKKKYRFNLEPSAIIN